MDFKEYQHYGGSRPVFWTGGIPWGKCHYGILRPLTAPHVEPKLRPGDIKKILQESKATLAMWTYNFDSDESRSWWWVIAKKPYSLETLDGKARYKIRHGLKHCSTKKISGQLLADIGYDCYKSAMHRHTQSVPEEESTFKRTAPTYDTNRTYEIWGVFVNDRLAGYGTYQILDNVVTQEDAIFDPEYFKYHQSYALMHAVTHYYLNERGCLYLTTGMRSISHPTEFEDFVIRNFGYRRAYTKLGLEYSLFLGALVELTYYSRPIWKDLPLSKNVRSKLTTIHKLQSILLEQGNSGTPICSTGTGAHGY